MLESRGNSGGERQHCHRGAHDTQGRGGHQGNRGDQFRRQESRLEAVAGTGRNPAGQLRDARLRSC